MATELQLPIATSVGREALHLARQVGGTTWVTWRVLGHLLRGRVDGRELLRSLSSYGPASLPVVVVTAIFAGAIVVLQGAIYVERYNAESLVGWYSGFATLREVGPLLIGLMFSGRVGASLAAELAAMRTTEQLDALEVLGVDRDELLVAPRVLSMVVGLALLTVLGNVVALLSSAATAWLLLDISPASFARSLTTQLGAGDLLLGIGKAMAYGLVIGVVASQSGLSARSGSRGVGRAVHRQVVSAALAMFAADYLISAWLG